MELDQQFQLDLAEPGPELPEIKDMVWDEEAGVWRADRVEGGYASGLLIETILRRSLGIVAQDGGA